MTPGSVAMLLGETTGLRRADERRRRSVPTTVRIQGLRGRYAQMLADGLPLYGASGDSFSLLQAPPLDLGQVEIIKGAASALYGPSALGGVVNLVARRPRVRRARGALQPHVAAAAPTRRSGSPKTAQRGWSWTVARRLASARAVSDLDEDGWTDLGGYNRVGAPAARVLSRTGKAPRCS